jgi:ribosomal 50S subunit-recycling heat shock protein
LIAVGAGLRDQLNKIRSIAEEDQVVQQGGVNVQGNFAQENAKVVEQTEIAAAFQSLNDTQLEQTLLQILRKSNKKK